MGVGIYCYETFRLVLSEFYKENIFFALPSLTLRDYGSLVSIFGVNFVPYYHTFLYSMTRIFLMLLLSMGVTYDTLKQPGRVVKSRLSELGSAGFVPVQTLLHGIKVPL